MNKSEKLLLELKLKISDILKRGDRAFPTELMLCHSYGLSRRTVRAALDVLVREGYLIRTQGRGSSLTGLSPGQNENRLILLLDKNNETFYPSLMQDLSEGMKRYGYSLEVLDNHGSCIREHELLELMLGERFIRGLFVRSILPVESPNAELFQRLGNKGTNIIFLNPAYPGLPMPELRNDYHSAIASSIRHFRRLHTEHIYGAFQLDRPEECSRFSAFLKAAISEGLSPDPDSILLLSHNEGRGRVREFLKHIPARSGLLCGSGELLSVLFSQAHALNISLVEELNIVFFDEGGVSEPIEGVHPIVPAQAASEAAAGWMLEMLKKPNFFKSPGAAFTSEKGAEPVLSSPNISWSLSL